MIVSQFQAWAENAPAPSRADGVSALARALLYSSLDPEQSQAAVVALAGFLDDPSPLVRRALADAFASAADAPRAIVLALSEDEPSIASIVLSRSPVLGDAELIDCAATSCSQAQEAIASRPYLSALVAAALAEAGSAEALVALAENLDADLPAVAIERMIERHGGHADLRAALLARGNLPIEVRFELVAITARSLAAFVAGRGWTVAGRIERAAREATEKAAIAIAAADESSDGKVSQAELGALAAYLRNAGRLTPGFALRALLSGNREFFDAMLSVLSGMAVSRVQGLTKSYESMGFAAVYRKSGLPAALLPAFRIALGALRNWDSGGCDCLYLPLVIYVHDQCAALNDGAFDKLLVLLRRFEAEASRDEARTQKLAALAAQTAFAAGETFVVEEIFVAGEACVASETTFAEEPGFAGESAVAAEPSFAPEPYHAGDFSFIETPSFFVQAAVVEESCRVDENTLDQEVRLGGDAPAGEEAFDAGVALFAGAAGVSAGPIVEFKAPAPANSFDGAGEANPGIPVVEIEDETMSRIDYEEPVLARRPHWIKAAKHAADAKPQNWARPKRNIQWVNVEADLAQFETELYAA